MLWSIAMINYKNTFCRVFNEFLRTNPNKDIEEKLTSMVQMLQNYKLPLISLILLVILLSWYRRPKLKILRLFI